MLKSWLSAKRIYKHFYYFVYLFEGGANVKGLIYKINTK